MSELLNKTCDVCGGVYFGDDIYHHSCSQCWNCGKSFLTGKNPAKRFNPYDRFQPYYNTCVNCAKRNINPPIMKHLENWMKIEQKKN